MFKICTEYVYSMSVNVCVYTVCVCVCYQASGEAIRGLRGLFGISAA